MYGTERFQDQRVPNDAIKVELLGRKTVSIWGYEDSPEDRRTTLVDLDRETVVKLVALLDTWLDATAERRTGEDRRAK